jgi:xylulose-5-phosphate/fructose-6-phosphate phosphoketolase
MTAVADQIAGNVDVEQAVGVLAKPTPEEIERVDAWWRANNYLTIGQIYVRGKPMLRERLAPRHIKPRLLGHWRNSPDPSFAYAHMSRLIGTAGGDLPGWSGAKRPGVGGRRLSGRRLLRDLPCGVPGRGRDAAFVQPVLQPWRHSRAMCR